MRVVILSQYFPPDMGGGATRAYNVAKGLLRAGCAVTVVCAAPHYPNGRIPSDYRWKPLVVDSEREMRIIRTFVPPLSSKGIVRRILLFATFMLSSLFALPLIRSVDVVFAANPNITATFSGVLYSRLKNCPLIQNVDDLWPEALFDLGLSPQSLLGRVGIIMANMAYHLASAITPISPGYVDVLRLKYRIDPSRIHVVMAGANLEVFSTSTKPANSEKPIFRVLYIGSLSPAYDFDQVLEAARILSTTPDIEFIVQGDGELAADVKQKITRLALPNLRLVRKIVSRAQVARLLQEADALLLPLVGVGSIELGISSKLYEYQAAGKPILCCSKGEPGRFVAETHSGIVIEPRDSSSLADSVLRLRNNPQLAQELGENGRKFVEGNLSVEAIGMKMRAVFEGLTSRRPITVNHAVG